MSSLDRTSAVAVDGRRIESSPFPCSSSSRASSNARARRRCIASRRRRQRDEPTSAIDPKSSSSSASSRATSVLIASATSVVEKDDASRRVVAAVSRTEVTMVCRRSTTNERVRVRRHEVARARAAKNSLTLLSVLPSRSPRLMSLVLRRANDGHPVSNVSSRQCYGSRATKVNNARVGWRRNE